MTNNINGEDMASLWLVKSQTTLSFLSVGMGGDKERGFLWVAGSEENKKCKYNFIIQKKK